MAGAKTEEAVTPEELKELLSYDPNTGLFVWLDRPLKFFHDSGGRYTAEFAQKVFRSLFAGKPALTAKNPGGYLRGNLFGRNLMAHRAAFCLVAGRWPMHQVDHINGVRDDNRWDNLREATNAQNQHNSSSAKGSSSRFIGVALCKRSHRWTAYICPDGTKIHLGNFGSEEEAARVRDEAAKKMFGAYARLNFP
jgi:hypothetical protein